VAEQTGGSASVLPKLPAAQRDAIYRRGGTRRRRSAAWRACRPASASPSAHPCIGEHPALGAGCCSAW